MEILDQIMLVILILAAILFFVSLYYSVQGKIKWTEFMAMALLCLDLLCVIILYFANNSMSRNQINNLTIACIVFCGLSWLFHWAYQLNKNKEDEKNT